MIQELLDDNLHSLIMPIMPAAAVRAKQPIYNNKNDDRAEAAST